MDTKQELRKHFIAQRVMAIIIMIIWLFIYVFLVSKVLTQGTGHLEISDWVFGCIGILIVVFEIFRFRSSGKNLKALK